MSRTFITMAAIAAAVTSQSCRKFSTDPGLVCTQVAIAAVYVRVEDRLNDTPPPFVGLWARAVDGNYRDSTTMSFTNQQTGAVSMALAYERPGTYTVTVHANGYLDYERTGVVVTKDECHVIPVEVVARLSKP